MTATLASPELSALASITGPTDQMLWDLIDTELIKDAASVAAVPALTSVLQVAGPTCERAAASAAVEVYTARRAAAGVAHIPFRTFLAPLATPYRWESLALWAIGTGATTAVALVPWDVVVPRVVGGVHRTVADAFRHTIMQNSIADPAARGWRRVPEVDACDFCRMLADRGGVYTESSVKFAAHDHCNCSADAEFRTAGELERFEYKRSERSAHLAALDDEYRLLSRTPPKDLNEKEQRRLRRLWAKDTRVATSRANLRDAIEAYRAANGLS